MIACLALATISIGFQPSQAAAQGAPNTQEQTRADYQRTLQLLGVTEIRQGADGRDLTAPNAANYDETMATLYQGLPDPLLTNDRTRVTTPDLWWNVRRPEIEEFFDREVYGRAPDVTPEVRWEIVSVRDTTLYGVPVTAKQLLGRVDNAAFPAITVEIQALLATPSGATEGVPVIVSFSGVNFDGPGGGFAPGGGFGGGQNPNAPPADGPPPPPRWQQQLLEKGWGYAMLAPNSIQADNGAGLTSGIIGLVNQGQPRDLDDWGSLRAWGWGASRLLDYLETDPTVDATRVGITGHSRYGKAAAVTMAYDNRFAIGFTSSSGAGGLKLYRRNYGELVENVAAPNEYHWMAGNFIKYAGLLTWDDLPVDSHELVAMIAPRPVFISSGQNGDEWVDAKGMFLAGAHAGPVYELLGKRGLGTMGFPPVETGLMSGEIAFRQHSGGHTQTPNWPTFITWAERYLDAPE